jgi:hypothetical protein
MKKLREWEANGVTVRIPISPDEKRKTELVAAVNAWGMRWQIAQWIRDGIERDMPNGKLVVR